MLRTVLSWISLGLIVLTLSYFGLTYYRSIPESTPPMKKSIEATCTIVGEEGNLGTGILLNTGYVLTAGHCVDLDLDGAVSPEERNLVVAFNAGKDLYGARVVYLGEDDFAFLELDVDLTSEVSLAYNTNIGDDIYTIGAMLGRNLMISRGVVSEKDGGWARASCFVSRGNSGGGIFDQDGNLVGVTSSVAVSPLYSKLRVPAFTPDGDIVLFQTTALGYQEINCLCIFVTSHEIRSEVREKHLSPLIDLPKEPTLRDHARGPWGEAALRIAISEGVFLLVVFVAWRKLHR